MSVSTRPIREPAAPAQKDTFTSQPGVPEGSGKESDSSHFLLLPASAIHCREGRNGSATEMGSWYERKEESVNAGHQAASTGTQP